MMPKPTHEGMPSEGIAFSRDDRVQAEFDQLPDEGTLFRSIERDLLSLAETLENHLKSGKLRVVLDSCEFRLSLDNHFMLTVPMAYIPDQKPTSSPMAKTFTFTVVLEGVPNFDMEAASRLSQAGCYDCTAGIHGDELHLIFNRESATCDAAIDSALADIRKANLGGRPQRVERDLRK